jgi:hypothetical protein
MSEECNGQRRSAAQSGSRSQIGPACIGRERHYWRRVQGPASMHRRRDSQCTLEHCLLGCCIGRVPGDGSHSDIHAACLAYVVAFSPSTRGSIAAVTHGLHMSAALPHVKCRGMRCDGAVLGTPMGAWLILAVKTCAPVPSLLMPACHHPRRPRNCAYDPIWAAKSCRVFGVARPVSAVRSLHAVKCTCTCSARP